MRGVDPEPPGVDISWKDVLIITGAVAAVISIVLCGWTISIDYIETNQVAAFGQHVAASETDLFLLAEEISSCIGSLPEYPSLAECDASMREFAALADYGRRLTAYHRQIIAADEVPEAYMGAKAAYIRALDHLNRAFSLWLSAAGAYDAKAYTAAEENLAMADQAWKDYSAAIDDYNQELQTAEEGEEG